MEINNQSYNMIMAEKEYDETLDQIIQRLVRMNRIFFKCGKLQEKKND